MKKKILNHLKRLLISNMIIFGIVVAKTLVMYSQGVVISTTQMENAIQCGMFFSVWLFVIIEMELMKWKVRK